MNSNDNTYDITKMGSPELFLKKGTNGNWYIGLSWENKVYGIYSSSFSTYKEAKAYYLNRYNDICIRKIYPNFNKNWSDYIKVNKSTNDTLCKLLGLSNG